jgi:carboxylesterase type B
MTGFQRLTPTRSRLMFKLWLLAAIFSVAFASWPAQGHGGSILDTAEYAEFWAQRVAETEADVSVSVGVRPVVRLSDGTRLQGIKVENSTVNAFKGVRFAQAPVGSLRWAPPKKYVNPDPSVMVEAGHYRASCVQGVPLSKIGDEDCLFLNVWTPADASVKSKLPVGVFVHGGSYNTGGGAMYSGAEMVEFYKGKVIMVTINYRLNVFGFLGSEMLRALDVENGSTGNTGIQDQRMALQWIQENIGKEKFLSEDVF